MNVTVNDLHIKNDILKVKKNREHREEEGEDQGNERTKDGGRDQDGAKIVPIFACRIQNGLNDMPL